MIGWERIDMCTVVPYEYMSVGDVLNGLIYLILSSPTRIDAVWRNPRVYKILNKMGCGLIISPETSLIVEARRLSLPMPPKVVAASGVLVGGVGKRRSDEAP
jgi:hypothetical protein